MPQSNNNEPANHVVPGMPALEHDGKATSYFEFWPLWLMYLPVVLQWLVLAIRYRSLTVPLLANPALPLSGMVGVAKSKVFEVAGDSARQWILPWWVYPVSSTDLSAQLRAIATGLQEHGLQYPLVAKPNIGCRGAGVKLLQGSTDLEAYVRAFPAGGAIQFQALAKFEPEAGVFYVRYPGQSHGEITSLTLKYTPYVVGDGRRTLAELVAADPRAGTLLHLYQKRHAQSWQQVVATGEAVRLVFSASHCRGAVFRDGRDYITPELTQALDRLFDDIPGFHYGRLDIKFRDLQSLQAGEDIEIIEINGASAESINIWDRRASLRMAIATLLQQYRTLFKLGVANRKRGHKPPGITALWRAWRYENNLVKQYPHND